MARLENALLGEGIAFGKNAQARMLDPRYGGQSGYAPVLGEWVSSAMQRRMHLIPILLQYPRAFDLLPDSARWIGTLKAIVERHPLTIEGLNGSLTVNTTPNPVGGGGQNMHEFTNVMEEESNVVMTWNERYGAPISRFWRRYITTLMMDPHSKFPNLATITGARNIEDLLPDMYSFSMLFIEPNPLHNQVQNAWVVANMFPQSSGEIIGSMDKQSDLNTMPLNITFGGLAQYGDGPAMFAKQILDTIDITNAAPTSRKAFIDEIQSDILNEEYGYKYSAEKTGIDAINT